MSYETVGAREPKEYPTFILALMIVAAAVALVSIGMAAIYYKTYAGNSYKLKEKVNDGEPHCYYNDPESTSQL